MKASIKLAVIGLAVAGGAAQAATITNLPSSSGGSDLVLFLKNYTDGTFYVQDLGVQTSALRSQAQLAADTPSLYSLDTDGATTGPLNESAISSLASSFSSGNLASYLSGNTSDNIKWTIMGANQGTGTLAQGSQSFVMTSAIDQLNAYWDSAKTASARAGTLTFFGSDVNNSTFTNGVSTSSGWDDTSFGANADISFQSAGFANGTTLGGAQTLYLVTTSGAGAGADTYASLGTLTLSSAGLLSYSADTTVTPIPAALWLLGSGLMGLVGIGRRRGDVAVTA